MTGKVRAIRQSVSFSSCKLPEVYRTPYGFSYFGPLIPDHSAGLIMNTFKPRVELLKTTFRPQS